MPIALCMWRRGDYGWPHLERVLGDEMIPPPVEELPAPTLRLRVTGVVGGVGGVGRWEGGWEGKVRAEWPPSGEGEDAHGRRGTGYSLRRVGALRTNVQGARQRREQRNGRWRWRRRG